jgi:hypothetical protein
MKYKALAKHYIFEAASNLVPRSETGIALTEDGKEFTEAQLRDFTYAYQTEIESMRQKLVAQNVIVDG